VVRYGKGLALWRVASCRGAIKLIYSGHLLCMDEGNKRVNYKFKYTSENQLVNSQKHSARGFETPGLE
jgi:hypothetical protein